MSDERHPSSARYHELLEWLGALHDRKQSDYGRDDDPFANVRAAEEWGFPGWVGAMMRASDKVRRLQAQARRGSLSNESALDAFDDLAVYAVIGRVLFEEELSKNGGGTSPVPFPAEGVTVEPTSPAPEPSAAPTSRAPCRRCGERLITRHLVRLCEPCFAREFHP